MDELEIKILGYAVNLSKSDTFQKSVFKNFLWGIKTIRRHNGLNKKKRARYCIELFL